MRFLIFLLLIGFVSAPQARATVFGDIASPVTTPAWMPLAIGGGLTLVIASMEDQIDDPIQQSLTEHRPLGQHNEFSYRMGQMVPNVAYIGGMIIAGTLGAENAYKRAEIMSFASLYAGGFTALLKETIKEPRPNAADDLQSFPSGHATVAFAFASVVGAEHGIGWGVPAYALASMVGLSRMTDNKHRLHDVIGGATVGISYGLGLHYRRKNNPETSLIALPFYEGGAGGMKLALRF